MIGLGSDKHRCRVAWKDNHHHNASKIWALSCYLSSISPYKIRYFGLPVMPVFCPCSRNSWLGQWFLFVLFPWQEIKRWEISKWYVLENQRPVAPQQYFLWKTRSVSCKLSLEIEIWQRRKLYLLCNRQAAHPLCFKFIQCPSSSTPWDGGKVLKSRPYISLRAHL